jgi:hypothetical protein
MAQRGDDWRRRNVLKLIGASSAATVGGAGTALAGDGDGFTTQEMNRFRREIREHAVRDLAATEELSAENIPDWLPSLPTGLPFEFCAQIPFVDDVCTIAQSPVSIGSYRCNGVTYDGLKASMSVAWGPSVEIQYDDFSGNIEYEASLDLLVDPSKFGCPIALKVASGTGQEACIQPPQCDIDPTETVVALADKLYNAVYDAVKDGFQQIGYVPPEQVLVAITALACIAYAVTIGVSPLPGPADT